MLIVRIVSKPSDPSWRIPFLNAGKGQGGYYRESLPVQTSQVDQLPGDLDAIVVTADLQGRETFESSRGHPPRLSGEVVPEELENEILPELGIDPQRCGAILAGDFYTVPTLDRRGGTGDVTAVWQAFGRCFRWVTGVAGNHDTFASDLEHASQMGRNIHFLDDQEVVLSELTIAGIGGIVGDPRRNQRKSDQHFRDCLQRRIHDELDILILHDGPGVPEQGLKGSPLIRMIVDLLPPPLIIRGHSHWETPLVDLPCGTQVLNVDSRIVILLRSP